MCSLPVDHNNVSEELIMLDECWSMYEELLDDGETREFGNFDQNVNHHHQLVLEDAGCPNKPMRKKKKIIKSDGGVAKKLDHNAKERIRRMKINASFLALRALLPHSTRSKKRWGAPAVVDKVVKYIPEMEKEVQELRSKKKTLQSSKKNDDDDDEIPTFSFNKVNQEEAVIQICMEREDYENGLTFIKLLQRVEDEGILINSVSALYICDTMICCHLHIQISDATFGVDYIEQLRDKIISWLR